MDAIESLDWGVYSHFDYLAQKSPEVLPVMYAGYYAGSYLGIAILLASAVALFLVLGRRRAAAVAMASVVLAFLLISAVRFLVPRPRPQKAMISAEIVGSYPSASVFLVMLLLIIIGFGVWSGTQSRWRRGLYVAVACGFTAWVSVSQLFLATHYLTDVIGAMAGATLIAWIAYISMREPEIWRLHQEATPIDRR